MPVSEVLLAEKVLEAVRDAMGRFNLGEEPVVVVNVAWKDGAVERSIGTAVPSHCRSLLGDSLRQSADEADDSYRGSGC